jgi:hypothetical protein
MIIFMNGHFLLDFVHFRLWSCTDVWAYVHSVFRRGNGTYLPRAASPTNAVSYLEKI